jgi:hypothetical protein
LPALALRSLGLPQHCPAAAYPEANQHQQEVVQSLPQTLSNAPYEREYSFMNAWQKAVDVYREGLTAKEKKLFADSKPEDVLRDVAGQEAAQRESSRTRAFAQKL